MTVRTSLDSQPGLQSISGVMKSMLSKIHKLKSLREGYCSKCPPSELALILIDCTSVHNHIFALPHIRNELKQSRGFLWLKAMNWTRSSHVHNRRRESVPIDKFRIIQLEFAAPDPWIRRSSRPSRVASAPASSRRTRCTRNLSTVSP